MLRDHDKVIKDFKRGSLQTQFQALQFIRKLGLSLDINTSYNIIPKLANDKLPTT